MFRIVSLCFLELVLEELYSMEINLPQFQSDFSKSCFRRTL